MRLLLVRGRGRPGLGLVRRRRVVAGVGPTSGSSSDEVGLASSVEWATLAPLVLLAVIGVAFGGTWLHAQNMARQAAATGADVVAVGGSTELAVQASARVAGGLDGVRVDVQQRAGLVSVRVSGRAPLPGIDVVGEAQAWREP